MTASVAKAVLKGHKSAIVSLFDVEKSGTSILSSSYDGTVRLWDTRSKYASVRLIRVPGDEQSAGFAKQSDGSVVVVANGSRLMGFDLRADRGIIVSQPVTTFNTVSADDDINDFDVSGNTIAAPSDDGLVHLISLGTFTEHNCVSAHENIGAVARFLPSENLFVSGGYDCKVSVSKREAGNKLSGAYRSFSIESLLPEDDEEEGPSSSSINPPFVTSMEVSP